MCDKRSISPMKSYGKSQDTQRVNIFRARFNKELKSDFKNNFLLADSFTLRFILCLLPPSAVHCRTFTYFFFRFYDKFSAIQHGTEMLYFHARFPFDMIYIINQSTKLDDAQRQKKAKRKHKNHYFIVGELARVTTFMAIMCGIPNWINTECAECYCVRLNSISSAGRRNFI